jgi:hypothetical protein
MAPYKKRKSFRTLPPTKKDLKNRREFLTNLNSLSKIYFSYALNKILKNLENPSKTNPESLIISLRDKIEPAFRKKTAKIVGRFVNKSTSFYSRQIDDILIKNDLNHEHSKDRLQVLKEERYDYAVKYVNAIPEVFFSKALHILSNTQLTSLDNSILENIPILFALSQAVKKLKDLPRIIRNRNRLIVYDQTKKILAKVNELRYLEAGLYRYVWRTSEDERVVGNPAGLYPPSAIGCMKTTTSETTKSSAGIRPRQTATPQKP